MRPHKIETWMPEAAEIMVRENKSLKEAITDLGLALNSIDCANVGRRRSFQELLHTARAKYHSEVGTDPGLTKDAIAGQLKILADQLQAEGNAKDASQVLERLAKVKNWLGEGGTVNIFSGLTTRDIDEMRAKIEQSRDGSGIKQNPAN